MGILKNYFEKILEELYKLNSKLSLSDGQDYSYNNIASNLTQIKNELQNKVERTEEELTTFSRYKSFINPNLATQPYKFILLVEEYNNIKNELEKSIKNKQLLKALLLEMEIKLKEYYNRYGCSGTYTASNQEIQLCDGCHIKLLCLSNFKNK